jgi:hypothetical protein
MTDRKNILAVGIEPALFDEIAPPLLRRIFDVDRVPSPTAALELVSMVPFSALVLKFPLPELSTDDFIAAVRSEGSASSTATFALVAAEEHVQEASALLDRGIDLVLSMTDPPGVREGLLCTLLGIFPRTDTRVLVKLNIQLQDRRRDRFVGQTRDISASGMFVITRRSFTLGSVARFEFTLPGSTLPFRGSCHVTRHSTPETDPVQGMGFQFDSFDAESDQERLRRLLEALKQRAKQ